MCGRSLRAHGRAAAVRMRLLCRPQLHARGRCHAEHAPVHSKRNGCAPNAAGGCVLRPRRMPSCGCTGTRVGYRRSLFATRSCGSRLRTPRAHKRLPCVHKGPIDRTRATGDCGNSALPLVCAIAVHGSARRRVGQRALRTLGRHRWQYGITTSLCWNRCTRPSCSRSCKTPTVTCSPRCPRTSSG